MEGDQLSLPLFPEKSDCSGNFFNRKRDWSASKHRILLRYIQAHCYNLGGNKSYQSKYINYVDGFAGTGRYNEGIGIEDFVNSSNFWVKKYPNKFANTDGSPLIALKCAQIFSQEKRVSLRCLFVEADSNANEQLTNNCSSLDQSLFYKIYRPQTFEAAFSEVMNDLNGYPTLFFIDSFGLKGVSFEQICEIGRYLTQCKGELFFLFHNISVARHAGRYKEEYKSHQHQVSAENYMQNLTNFLGYGSEFVWKSKWIELKNQPQDFERWALEYFKERMRKEGGFRGVTSFEIKETYNDSRPRYSIVVGSNHPEKAFGEFLNEFVWEEEKLLFFQDDYQGNEKFLDKQWEAEQKRRIALIKTQSIQILREIQSEWKSFEDVITHIILKLDDLGYLKRTQHYNDILGSLYQEGMLKIQKPGSKKPYTLKSLLKIVE